MQIPSREELYQRNHIKRETFKNMAACYGVSTYILSRWFKSYDLNVSHKEAALASRKWVSEVLQR